MLFSRKIVTAYENEKLNIFLQFIVVSRLEVSKETVRTCFDRHELPKLKMSQKFPKTAVNRDEISWKCIEDEF